MQNRVIDYTYSGYLKTYIKIGMLESWFLFVSFYIDDFLYNFHRLIKSFRDVI